MPEVEDRVVAYHVGARGFGVALNCPPRFEKDVLHVVFEADEKCAYEMISENKNVDFRILPYCLGARNERGRFFLTKNAFASSNFEPNPQYSKYYCELHLHGEVDGVMLQGECYDVVYGNDYSVSEVRDVDIRTLDSIIDEEDAGFPYPDFLSLDTQGSELNILKGGKQAFADHCVALATEIELHPMYKGQPLFSSIFDFALSHGFHFVGFTYLQEISSNRLPIGARAKGFVAFGDALFLRSIDGVRSAAKSQDAFYRSLMKLAFIALNFGYLEYAMEVLDTADSEEPPGNLCDKLMGRDCYRILHELRKAVRECPAKFPHFERSLMTAERKKLLVKNENGAPTSAERPSPATTAIEGILGEYGYTWLADEVRRRRKSAERSVAGKMY